MLKLRLWKKSNGAMNLSCHSICNSGPLIQLLRHGRVSDKWAILLHYMNAASKHNWISEDHRTDLICNFFYFFSFIGLHGNIIIFH